jgi:cytochrome c peroxidase
MHPLNLTAQEKSDLVAFLNSLTSPLTPTAAPVLPR